MISFIYFDVGGVTIKDFSASDKWELFEKDILKIPQDKIQEFSQFFDEIEPEICNGKSVDEFIPVLTEKFHQTYPADFSILREFVKLFERNQSLWPIMKLLKSYFKVGLLTNMYPHMLDEISKAELLPPIDWDVVIDSSVVKARKPSEEIYRIAETKAECLPPQIMLIDNLQENLDTAQSRGWQTFLYNSADYEQSNRELANLLTHKLLL